MFRIPSRQRDLPCQGPEFGPIIGAGIPVRYPERLIQHSIPRRDSFRMAVDHSKNVDDPDGEGDRWVNSVVSSERDRASLHIAVGVDVNDGAIFDALAP